MVGFGDDQVAAILVLLIIAIDVRTPGRSHAILLTLPRWDARTFGTMLVGLAIAQIPLGILALQGATVWQAGAGSNLEVAGRCSRRSPVHPVSRYWARRC